MDIEYQNFNPNQEDISPNQEDMKFKIRVSCLGSQGFRSTNAGETKSPPTSGSADSIPKSAQISGTTGYLSQTFQVSDENNVFLYSIKSAPPTDELLTIETVASNSHLFHEMMATATPDQKQAISRTMEFLDTNPFKNFSARFKSPVLAMSQLFLPLPTGR